MTAEAAAATGAPRAFTARRLGAFGLMALALLAAIILAVSAGRYSVPPPRILEILWQAASGQGTGEIDARIVTLVRLPRVLLAGLSGAALAAGGAALQGVFRNPLVSPQVLGISQGAAFGGALAILAGFSGAVLLGMAFAFGLAALVLVGLLARIDGRTEVITVILAGMVVGALMAALVSVVQVVAGPNSSLPAIVYWLMGSFSTATWTRLGLAVPARRRPRVLPRGQRPRADGARPGSLPAPSCPHSRLRRWRGLPRRLIALSCGTYYQIEALEAPRYAGLFDRVIPPRRWPGGSGPPTVSSFPAARRRSG